jgi:hypothetical protein
MSGGGGKPRRPEGEHRASPKLRLRRSFRSFRIPRIANSIGRVGCNDAPAMWLATSAMAEILRPVRPVTGPRNLPERSCPLLESLVIGGYIRGPAMAGFRGFLRPQRGRGIPSTRVRWSDSANGRSAAHSGNIVGDRWGSSAGMNGVRAHRRRSRQGAFRSQAP